VGRCNEAGFQQCFSGGFEAFLAVICYKSPVASKLFFGLRGGKHLSSNGKTPPKEGVLAVKSG